MAVKDKTGMVIQTKYGYVEGVQNDGCRAYYGIPFAAPPVGELTFRHPVPPSPWEGVLKADSGSTNPVQVSGQYAPGNNSLDCLYLNIFVPDHSSNPAPVMVWVYGGSYSNGGAGSSTPGTTDILYDMTRFAKETGCIVVTFNYRLNVYGFLNLHYLDKSFDRNNGLYDQIMALRFVKENIAAFGGNPENVTLFGQSAGGACILALMTMKDADGLFQKTIVQSPCVDHFFTEEESEKNVKKFLQYAGIQKPSELMKLPEKELLAAVRKYNGSLLKKGDLRCAFSPTIDGVTLVGTPKEEIKKSKLPMLIGNVSEEGNLFVNPVPGPLLPILSLFLHISPKKSERSYRQRLSDALTEEVYVRPIDQIVKNYTGPVWRYVYDYAPPEGENGCCHISELPVLFASNRFMGRVDDEESERVGTKARKIWAGFAKFTDPGWESGSTEWIR